MEPKNVERYDIRDHEHLVETMTAIFGVCPNALGIRNAWADLCVVGFYTFNIEGERFVRLECV